MMNPEHKSDLIHSLMEAGDKKNKRVVLGCHDGEFHADELLASVVLMAELGPLGYKCDIVRSRDAGYLMDNCDIVYDVGDGKYDHHDRDKVLYPNGIPMAACGKILNDVILDQDLLDGLRYKLFYAVEAHDNGYTIPEHMESSKLSFVACFNPTWQEDSTTKALFKRFMTVLPMVGNIYTRVTRNIQADLSARKFIREQSVPVMNGRFLLMERYCPFNEYCKLHPEILGVIYPRDKQWTVRLTPTFKIRYETKISCPVHWRGLNRNALVTATGISDAIFCHRAGFIVTFGSKEGALKACEELLKQPLNESIA